ncbi:MAG: T9SS C-terminal target domain-containing protein, partial [Bacteroidetes bacterium]
ATTYGSGPQAGFGAGPLTDQGTTDTETCANWDRFFIVHQPDINAFKADWQDNGMIDNIVPSSILGWPGRGNPHFLDVNGYALPEGTFAPYVDINGDGVYNPMLGDYPSTKQADEAIWWVYNYAYESDTYPQAPGIEVHAMAYAYASDVDALNNTTFYDIKLINKSPTPLDSTYFSIWTDPDLGCYTDDYVGYNPDNHMAFVYNTDAQDGSVGCNCDQGVNTYCEEIPMVGILPLDGIDSQGNTSPSSFVVYHGYEGPPNQGDPNIPLEYYRLMQGQWLDGSPITDPNGEPIQYMYPGAPDNEDEWSMCSDGGAPVGDRRMLINFGPFNFPQGAIEAISFAVVGVEDVPHPCPSLNPLTDAANEVLGFYDILSAEESPGKVECNATVFPNPVTGQSVITLDAEHDRIWEVIIYTSNGKTALYQNRISNSQFEVGKSSLPAGVYFFRVATEEGKIGRGKFVVH